MQLQRECTRLQRKMRRVCKPPQCKKASKRRIVRQVPSKKP